MNDLVKDKFDDIAENYDSQRKKLIPCFDDFYNISVSVLESESDKPSILDIGAGTGLFSAKIVEKFPEARLTLIDLSSNMLDIAKERFAQRQNVKYIVEDYLNYHFDDEYDTVISALSIHHLEEEEKQRLFQKIYGLLKPGGIFLNADQFRATSSYIEAINKRKWRQSIKESGLSEEAVCSAYERINLDKESTLEQQLAWLSQIGFRDVDCIYKYYHFAVMFGRK